MTSNAPTRTEAEIGSVPLDAVIVAEQVIWLRKDVPTTPMHVLKLTFLAHGWSLGIRNQALIYDSVEAWQYGPVIPRIYHRYKSFGGDPITTIPVDHTDDLSPDQESLLEEVLDAYAEYSALQLSNITHQPQTPWATVVREYGVGAIIPNDLIRDYYHGLSKR